MFGRNETLNLGKAFDVETLRRPELIPYHVGHRVAVPGVEQADYLALGLRDEFPDAEPVGDGITDLNCLGWIRRFGHGVSRAVDGAYRSTTSRMST